MAILFNGVLRDAHFQDVLDMLAEFMGVYEPSRRFDCVLWDLMGWHLRDPQENEEWPQWIRGDQLCAGAVPQFSLDVRHSLELVALRRDDPAEFLQEVIDGMIEDDELQGLDFVRAIPVAAATLYVMRYHT